MPGRRPGVGNGRVGDAFDELAGDRLVVVDLQFSLFDITVGTANHHFCQRHVKTDPGVATEF